jgi:hypothetical protein
MKKALAMTIVERLDEFRYIRSMILTERVPIADDFEQKLSKFQDLPYLLLTSITHEKD